MFTQTHTPIVLLAAVNASEGYGDGGGGGEEGKGRGEEG